MQDFVSWWSRIPYGIDPYVFEIGSFRLGYYGLMYVVGFMVVYLLALYRIKKDAAPYTTDAVADYLVWAAFGLLIGARLGYVIIYNPGYYAQNLLEVFLPVSFASGGVHFTGIAGMSYHGGVIGVIAASIIYCRNQGVGFWEFGDFLAPLIPAGYMFGRLGNFINGELYGRSTTMPWGMYFPSDPAGVLRHPSQLYEAGLEGVVLFIVLWTLRKRISFSGFHLSLYIIGYGIARFVAEFFREPDAHLGFILGPMSMGQALSLLMVAAGCAAFALRAKKGIEAQRK